MLLQKHAVFINMSATGHMNPTLPLVARLSAHGCKVSYFVDQAMQSVVEAAGAAWYPFRYPGSDCTGIPFKLDERGIAKYVPEGTPKEQYDEMPFANFVSAAEQLLPALLEDLKAMDPPPSVIVYDPFLAHAQVAAHVLRVPAVAMVTMPGPGVLPMPDIMKEAWDSKPWVAGPAQEILSTYGFDVLKSGSLAEFYSPTLNLVTTLDELFAPPRPGRQAERFGNFPFKCVGVMKDSKVKRVANAGLKQDSKDSLQDDLPMNDIDAALSSGRRLLYISMGTVATGDRQWNTPFGPIAADNGLAHCTGKQLTQHVFRCCFEAVGGDDDFLVIMSLGPQSDTLEGLPPVPSNFIVRSAVPQLDVLQRCTAFLTHGGANSMHESLSFGVPMAVVPVFGDQPSNADSVARCGAGLSFRQPLSSVSAGALRTAILQLADASEGNTFRGAAQEMSEKLEAAGGVAAAADAILELASRAGVSKGGVGGA